VRDQFGNGIPGKQLAVTVAAGGGILAGLSATGVATLTTDAAGTATAPAWQLGKSARPQRLVASLVGGALLDSARATVQTSFDLDVRFVGTAPSAAVQQAFLDAAARIRGVITGDLPDVATGVLDVSECGVAGAPTINETIDDVVIYAHVGPIDGVGQILGQAGPCYARGTSTTLGLPFLGVMKFDEADLAAMVTNGTITDVMMHEMMHVLGFGSFYFGKLNLVSGFDTEAVAFLGANAARACREAGGTATCASTTPLEGNPAYGAGTRNSHLREATFDREVMTGFINGPVRPFSGITIGAFQDLGYAVNYDAKDTYSTLSALVADGPSASLSLQPGHEWETVLAPRMVVSADGRTRRRLVEVAP